MPKMVKSVVSLNMPSVSDGELDEKEWVARTQHPSLRQSGHANDWSTGGQYEPPTVVEIRRVHRLHMP